MFDCRVIQPAVYRSQQVAEALENLYVADLLNFRTCFAGFVFLVIGTCAARGAVISESPIGSEVIGIVSSELSPGPGVGVAGPNTRLISSALSEDQGNFSSEEHVRVAALSYEPSDLVTSVHLPRILSEKDIERYRRIHQLQVEGNWSGADVLIDEISNPILLGYVRFQKYMHPTHYRSKFNELADWLNDYADHPDAYRIYRLAMKRRPDGAAAPKKPKPGYLSGYGEERSDDRIRAPKEVGSRPKLVSKLTREIRSLVGRGRPTQAWQKLRKFEEKDWLSEIQFDRLRTDVARGYYAFGKDKLALEFAGASAVRSRAFVPEADWISGLAAWRLGLLGAARTFFESLAASETGDDFLKAGAAYWAARVHEADGRMGLTRIMLKKAAERPRTLYGLLALQALGEHAAFYWAPLSLRSGHIKELLKSDHVLRAIALAEVGQKQLSEEELRKYFPDTDIYDSDALLRLAVALDLPALQIRIGSLLENTISRPYEVALYPTPNWKLERGYLLDQALVLSVVRQESVFNEQARSRKGARGLMQLMPRTATFIDGDTRYHRSGKADQLYDPTLNLELGQRYLNYLLSKEMFDGNILIALAAYNSGPSTLKKWIKEVDYQNDPLLFVESVPSRETRWFLRRVLTNLGIYRDRLGQSSVWLNSIASGHWPKFLASQEASGVRQLARD